MAENGVAEMSQTNAPVNGEPNTIASPKRKHEHVQISHVAAPPTEAQQQDLLETLKSHDPDSVFLEHEFQERTNGPRSKRTKVSNANAHSSTSIAEKLAGRRYTHWTEIVGDAESVKDDIIRNIRQKDASSDDQQADVRPSIEELKRIQRANAITSLVVDIVSGEVEKGSVAEPANVKRESSDAPDDSNRIKRSPADVSGTVLTLFGNAPTPKQLFSSLQSDSAAVSSPNIKTELPVEEMNLPNGLSATRIKASVGSTASKATTFAEAFAIPFATPQMSPPKPSKRTTSKDNILTWEFKSPAKGSKRGGFTTQPLAVADWISYGVGESRHDSLSPLEKRKQRDRALSSSKSPGQSAKDDVSFAAELEKQEDALFQRAYSSFAPAFDNSKSLVDASVKNMVWWHKIGNKHFNERFAGEYALGAYVPLPKANGNGVIDDEKAQDDDFARVVEEYSDADEPPLEDELDLTDVDVVLRKIADLLQTLASYQWIRNTNLPSSTSASRPSIGPGSTVSGKSDKPDQPSDDEVEVYEQLRREIAFLILQLPPYAVAKIDGDQLAELGVSKYITFNTATYKGQLEEDQVARLSRYTAAATAASVASLTRSSASTNPHYSSSSRAPAIGQSANTRYGQSNSYVNTRASLPASSAQRTGTSNYGTPTAPPRAQYSQPGQYARPGLQHQSSASYNQANNTQYRQSTGYSSQGNYGTSYGQGTPQNQNRAGNYQASLQQQQQQQQQRTHTPATNAVAYQLHQATPQAQQGNAYNSAPSPAKNTHNNVTASGTIAHQFGQQFQPGSGQATPVNHASPAHTPVNGMQQARAPPPLVPRTNTPLETPQMQRPTSSSDNTAQAINGHA